MTIVMVKITMFMLVLSKHLNDCLGLLGCVALFKQEDDQYRVQDAQGMMFMSDKSFVIPWCGPVARKVPSALFGLGKIICICICCPISQSALSGLKKMICQMSTSVSWSHQQSICFNVYPHI